MHFIFLKVIFKAVINDPVFNFIFKTKAFNNNDYKMYKKKNIK